MSICTYVIAVILTLMCFYNIYFYLMKAGKYKVIANTLFYIIALIAIIAAVILASQSLEETSCHTTFWSSFFIIASCNQVLGIIQASVLTTLCIQLRSLFMFTDQLGKAEQSYEV